MSTIASWVQRADPSATAVVDDVEAVTYGELARQSAQLASVYRDGLGTGRYFLLPAQRSIAFVRALVAAGLSGNIAVPIDPQSPARIAEQIGERCGSWTLIDLGIGFDDRNPEFSAPADPERPELVLFTSGTSGIPKGVPVSSRNLSHGAKAVSGYLQYAQYPSAAVVLPLHYSYALLSQLLYMFYVGGLVRLFENFRNPIQFARVAERDELHTFCGVPSTYHALSTLHRMTPLRLPTFRVICSAGAAMDRSLVPVIKQIFPNAMFFDNYGMTEATPRISYVREDDPRFPESTCGRPIDGLEVRVLDEMTRRPLEDGRPGIIAVRGPNVFAGYLNDPESTREAFTPDGFLLSGDIGYVDDGYIYVQGRKDDVFNVAGEKVAPLEIEHALSQHPGVLACAVNRLHDEQRGDVPAAYVELAEPVERQSLVSFLNNMLPPAKVPLRIFEVRAFPLTGNGKLQRARLAPESEEFVVRELM